CFLPCGTGNTCSDPETYCSDDGVCVPDTRPRPFCDAAHPCSAPSQCIGGICRVPCTDLNACRTVDVSFQSCDHVPTQPASVPGTYCLTGHEARPLCSRQSECAVGQSCVDGTCN